MKLAPLLVLVGACASEPDERPTPEPAEPVEVAGIDVAVDAEGTTWVSWVSDDDVFVARSEGGTLSEGFQVTTGGHGPTVGTARRPHLAVDESRVAVTFSDGVTPDAEVWLYLADRDTLDFTGHLLGQTGVNDTLDQPTVAFGDGEVWVAWKFGKDHEYGLALGRESEGWSPTVVTGFPGQPCECCPHELTISGSDVVVVQRGNELNLREIYLGFVATDGAAEVYRVSKNDWIVAGCPYDGPATTRTGSGRLIATWVDATLGDARAWVSRSEDGGVTWDDADLILPESERSQAWPSLAADGEDVWMTVEEIWLRTRLFHSADGGVTWEEEAVAEDLVDALVASGGGQTSMIGLNADDHLVLSVLGSPP